MEPGLDGRTFPPVVRASLVLLVAVLSIAPAASEDITPPQQRLYDMESAAVAEPFIGVTTDGTVIPGLYPIPDPVIPDSGPSDAATALLSSLDDVQRAAISFPLSDVQWRRWSNSPPTIYYRRGLALQDLSPEQVELALALVRTALSKQGWRQVEDVMRLGHYGTGSYWLAVLGTPSDRAPWGWQLQGHHLALNCLVFGNEIILTPTFMGAEPAIATDGPLAGTSVLQQEQELGLVLARMLSEEQLLRATVPPEGEHATITADAFHDNQVVGLAGIPASTMNEAQKDALVRLVRAYLANLRDADAQRMLGQVERHLDETVFAWTGGTDGEPAFYYRVYGPVLLIEFNHELPFFLPVTDRNTPNRLHVHTVVRTPNGNDYGTALVRQYLERPNGAEPGPQATP